MEKRLAEAASEAVLFEFYRSALRQGNQLALAEIGSAWACRHTPCRTLERDRRPLFPAMSRADTSVMLETPVAVVVLAVWTFRRREDVLALSREQTDEGYQLVVTECGRPRTFGFRNLERLIHFQHDMEAFLVRTGWRLADFTPDRRGGDDRRDLPREDNDRRRWWTDVVRDHD